LFTAFGEKGSQARTTRQAVFNPDVMTADARRPSDDLVAENATLRRRVAEREQRVAAPKSR